MLVFAQTVTNYTAASPVPVTKEQTYCYNLKLAIYMSDGYSLIK